MVNWKLEKTALIFDRRRVFGTGTGSPPCQTRSVSGLPLVLDGGGVTNSWDSFFYWVIGTFKLTFHSMICQIVS